jgi:16S rRNA (adenine1518-N6/adenine1519-N6)-dimethyltransferase
MSRPRGNPPVLKKFGQHFLGDIEILQSIADAVITEPGDTVIEIGPGRGALTDILASRDNELIAIEIDRALSEQLRGRYANNPKVKIVERDVLQVDITSIVNGPFVVVGNVPYYITTPILFHVMRPPFPRSMVFLVQREVAERIVSKPDTREYGALSVNVQAIANAEIIRLVPPGAFHPPPKVASAVIRIVPRSDPLIEHGEVERFRVFVQSLFGMRRKQLGNTLRTVSGLSGDEVAARLSSLGIDPRVRSETLSPVELVSLFRVIQRESGSAGPSP